MTKGVQATALDADFATMYTYIVERTQIYLTARQNDALDAAAKRTGQTKSRLIRDAIDATYITTADVEEVLAVLDETAGTWSGGEETGEEFVDRMRTRGIGQLHQESEERGRALRPG